MSRLQGRVHARRPGARLPPRLTGPLGPPVRRIGREVRRVGGSTLCRCATGSRLPVNRIQYPMGLYAGWGAHAPGPGPRQVRFRLNPPRSPAASSASWFRPVGVENGLDVEHVAVDVNDRGQASLQRGFAAPFAAVQLEKASWWATTR